MSRKSLIQKLKEKNPYINLSESKDIVDSFTKNLEKALLDGKNIELRGFGTFFVKKIKEKYSARNPGSGKLIYIPQKNKVRFRTSKRLNKKLNK